MQVPSATDGDYPVTPVSGFADPVSSWTHLLGAAVVLVAGTLLVARFRGPVRDRVGLVIFVCGAAFMFSMSGVYHLLSPGSTSRYVLRHLDHAAIWVMIAGTFTPIHLMLFRGWGRWGVLTLIWTAAITGIVLKTIFFDDFPEWLGLAFYLGLGWVGCVTGIVLIRRLGVRAARSLIYGGLAYSFGAVFEFLQPPFLIPGVIGPHEVFHFAVIVGVIYHWGFVKQATLLALTPTSGA